MRSLTRIATAVALAIVAGGVAQAQDRRDNRYDNQRNDVRHDQRNNHNVRGHDNHDGDWRRGGRLPAEYRNRHYVVQDWHGHHLHRPPNGYQWVQRGNDYALAAVATGIITELLINHH